MTFETFGLELQDGICRFDMFHLIIGALLIFMQISFKWINTVNNGDTTATTTATKVWNN